MIARVRAVTAAATAVGSRLNVRSSMSANTGRAPTWMIVFAVATKLKALVITSSPGPMPCASRARWRAAVPEETAIAWPTPKRAANSDSRAATCGPWTSMPESSTARTAAFSSSPMSGREIGMCGAAGPRAPTAGSFVSVTRSPCSTFLSVAPSARPAARIAHRGTLSCWRSGAAGSARAPGGRGERSQSPELETQVVLEIRRVDHAVDGDREEREEDPERQGPPLRCAPQPAPHPGRGGGAEDPYERRQAQQAGLGPEGEEDVVGVRGRVVALRVEGRDA